MALGCVSTPKPSQFQFIDAGSIVHRKIDASIDLALPLRPDANLGDASDADISVDQNSNIGESNEAALGDGNTVDAGPKIDGIPLYHPDANRADLLPNCLSGQIRCGLVCVDPESDPANCGGCNGVCPDHDACYQGICIAPPAPGAQLVVGRSGL